VSQISEEIRARVRASAQDRCGYCQSLQKYVLGILEIEHIIPKAAGGSEEEENLWLACRLCNSYKGVQTQCDRSLGTSISIVIRMIVRLRRLCNTSPDFNCDRSRAYSDRQ
jgi:HNH endonuclease